MPNKPIQHTELDKAIKENLHKLQVNNSMEWEEIREALSQKQQNTNPLTGLPLNLNSIAVVGGTAGSILNISAAIRLFKRWSGPVSYIAGTITVAIGGYYIFDSSNQKRATKQEIKTEQVKDFQPAAEISKSGNPPSNLPVTPSALPVTQSTGNEMETTLDNSAGVNRADSPQSDKEALVKTRSRNERTATVKENNEIPAEASPIVNKRDTSSAFESREEEAKSSKILYYKENLTLDRLEQELGKAKRDSLK